MINEEKTLNIIQENNEATINEVESIDGVLNVDDKEEGTLYIEEELPEEFIKTFKKDVSE